MPHKVSGSKRTQWKYHWNRNLYERSQRSLDEKENHSGTAVKGFRKSEYERDFMAVPSIYYGVTCVRNEHHGSTIGIDASYKEHSIFELQ